MDLITQGLLGSTVSQALCDEKNSRKAAFFGFLLGILPDFDVVSILFGDWASLKYHRGPSHSLIVLFLLTFPVAKFFTWLSKEPSSYNNWLKISFWALMTHPLLDWCTTYGTPLFWPLSNARFANDAISIIDPIYSLPLLLATFSYYFIKKFSTRKNFALIAIFLSTLYLVWGYGNSVVAINKAKQNLSRQGIIPIEVRATPTFLNTLVWRVIAKLSSDDFMITYLSINNSSKSINWTHIKSDKSPEIQIADNHPRGKLFKWFAMNMTVSKVAPNNKNEIIIKDLRYGTILDPALSLFSATAILKDQKITKFERQVPHQQLDLTEDLKATWKKLISPN